MNITISDNLKELRKNKNNTQEDLAEFLTISIAAVSKWERGESYPDIELLPRIAVFYDTKVDDLLGVGKVRKDQKIREYAEQTFEFWKSGDSLACVELWRKAAKEFPNDNAVMFNLLQALTNAAYGAFPADDKADEATKAKRNEFLKEAVEIGEALSAKANDQTIMYQAMYRLCIAYKQSDEVEKAVKVANKLPYMWLNKEDSLLDVLEDSELKTHSQGFLLSLINSFFRTINALNCCDYDNEQIIKINRKAIQIIKLLFEDGDYGVRHLSFITLYFAIATTYAKTNDTDAVIENLSVAAEHAISYDLLEENVSHTSLLFNMLKTQKNGKTYMFNESYQALKKLDDKIYDFCREDERFAEIRNRLMTFACEDISTR